MLWRCAWDGKPATAAALSNPSSPCGLMPGEKSHLLAKQLAQYSLAEEGLGVRLSGESGRFISSCESSSARLRAPRKCYSYISPPIEPPSLGLICTDPYYCESSECGTLSVASGERVSDELLNCPFFPTPSFTVKSTDGACTLGKIAASSFTMCLLFHFNIYPGVSDPEQSESSLPPPIDSLDSYF